MHLNPESKSVTDSATAWWRLAAGLTLSTIGGVGMWSVVVALPTVQAEFGVARGDASLPYTLTMILFGMGGILMGRWSDRSGIMFPVIGGALALTLGYLVAGSATTLWQFAIVQGVLIGVGSSATFAPLLADTSQWFVRRRGIAVGIFASGNYLAGTLWPPTCCTSPRPSAGAAPTSALAYSAWRRCCRFPWRSGAHRRRMKHR